MLDSNQKKNLKIQVDGSYSWYFNIWLFIETHIDYMNRFNVDFNIILNEKSDVIKSPQPIRPYKTAHLGCLIDIHFKTSSKCQNNYTFVNLMNKYDVNGIQSFVMLIALWVFDSIKVSFFSKLIETLIYLNHYCTDLKIWREF